MVKINEFKKFYEISWKLRSVALVLSQLKLEYSKVWSGIPYISRKQIGMDKVSDIFNTITLLNRKIAADLNSLGGSYQKLYKNIIVNLQNLGVFFNRNFAEDTLVSRVEENDTVTDGVNELIKKISSSLNLPDKPTKNIEDPTILDLFKINKARIKLIKVIIEESKNQFNEILNFSLDVTEKAKDELVVKIKENCKNINDNLDRLIALIPSLDDIFDVLTNNIINALKDAFIELDENNSNEKDIYEVVCYADLSEIYRMLRGTLKQGDAFVKLLKNRGDDANNSSIVEEQIVKVNQ